jgi:hypothetical protein
MWCRNNSATDTTAGEFPDAMSWNPPLCLNDFRFQAGYKGYDLTAL